MKRLPDFPWGEKRVDVSRRPLAIWMAVFLALAWLPAATAEPAENRPLVPEPAVAPGDELAAKDPPSSDAEPPRNAEQSGVALQQDDAEELPTPEPSNNHAKRHAVARQQEADEQPAADEPYAEEEDDCEACPRCPSRCGGPATGWQRFASRLEARGEWLLWWGKGNSVPALVTTGPSTSTQDQAGALGSPGTVVLLGNSDLNDTARSGARIAVDYWLNCDHSVGVEAQYFGLGDDTASFQANSNGFPVPARPFFNYAKRCRAGPLHRIFRGADRQCECCRHDRFPRRRGPGAANLVPRL